MAVYGSIRKIELLDSHRSAALCTWKQSGEGDNGTGDGIAGKMRDKEKAEDKREGCDSGAETRK